MFQGNIPTTFAYDAGLAETASGLFGTGVDNLLVDQESLRYPIDDAAVTRVLRFCHAVRFMSHVHSMLRYAGKGVVFRFEGRDPVPSPSPAHDEQKAIRLFDDRLGEEIGPFRRGGTKLAEESPGGNDVVIVVHR